VFGRKRRQRAQREADDFVHRLAEVNDQIDRRPLLRIDLRDQGRDLIAPPAVPTGDDSAEMRALT
jgi:hypothetical protein